MTPRWTSGAIDTIYNIREPKGSLFFIREEAKRCRKRAEETLCGELAVALEIPKDSVESYIRETIEKENAAR